MSKAEELLEHEPVDDALEFDRRMARLDSRLLRVIGRMDYADEALDAAERRAREVTDEEFLHALGWGAAAGIPAVFVLVLTIATYAGFALGMAAMVAMWASVVAGPYMGGLGTLAYRCHLAESPQRRAAGHSRRLHRPAPRTA